MRAKLSIVGAAGRMGKRIVSLAKDVDQLDIIGAVEIGGHPDIGKDAGLVAGVEPINVKLGNVYPACLLYTSPSPRDRTRSRMPSSA